MPTASLTRRVLFSAAHRYRRPDWTEEKNSSTFGACSWPNFHGHNYRCDVTVSGPVDEATGFLIDLGELDAILESEVMARFDHRNINLEVPEFADGKMIPSGENLARFVFEKVQARLTGASKVSRVTIAEDTTLSSTYEA
ncbi:MAG: 6-carboxytetrahydropterin synthase [Gemmatimonadaceae bacterium]|nr:6-carboxytetrahydropterin synthase [Gemmatimonadaceae bacterium]